MHSKLAALALAGLAALQYHQAPVATPQSFLAASESIASLPIVRGPVRGVWTLPLGQGRKGEMQGLFLDAGGAPFARLDAVVEEGVSTIHVLRTGAFHGDVNLPGGAAYPRYRVHGTWTAIAFTGQGWFEGMLTMQPSPGGAEFPIGVLRGVNKDDVSTPGGGGRFAGEWRATL